MGQDKEFDKYLKGMFEENPEVPAELNWENMDFDLPKITANETPTAPAKKKDRKFWLLLLLLLFSAGGIGYGVYRVTGEKLPMQAQTELLEQVQNQSQTQLQKKSQAKVQTQEEQQKQTQTQLETSTGHTDQITATQKTVEDPISSLPQMATQKNIISTNSKNNTVAPISPKTTIREIKTSVKATTAKQVEARDLLTNNRSTKSMITASSSLTVPSIASTTNTKSEITTSASLSPLPLNKAVRPINELDNLATLNEAIKQLFTPILTENNDDKKSAKIRIQEFVVGYGITTFNLDMEPSNDLHGKINSVLSNSFQAGLRFNIMDTWSSNMMIKYDRYHTTLDFRQELEPIFDIQNGTKTNREEVTFHNNFTNTLGLELGLQKRFALANRLSFYAGLQVTPTYTLNTSGKTVMDDVPTPLVYDPQINRLSLQGGLHTGLLFSISPAVNLEVAYQYNNFLMGDIFINDDIGARRQSSFLVRMSYQFKK